MRVLGVDYGQARIGLAISDETGTVAQGLDYIPGGGDHAVCRALLEVAQQRQADKIVVGVPVRLDGQASPQTERTKQFMTVLQQATTVPVERWDERLTTVQAQRTLIEGNVRRKDRKEKVDMLAAQLMLQSYLDAKNLPGASEA